MVPTLLRDQFAIGVGDAGRLVDRDANRPLVPTAFELDFDQFHASRLLYALHDFFDLGCDASRIVPTNVNTNKKVGFRPLHWLDPSTFIVPC